MNEKTLAPLDDLAKIGDGVAITITIGTVVNILPAVAAILTILWTLIRIYETATVQRWLRRWRKKDEGK